MTLMRHTKKMDAIASIFVFTCNIMVTNTIPAIAA